MREVLTIHLGQCGNQIGEKFWSILAQEHCIDASGQFHGCCEERLVKINSFFDEVQFGKRYTPRALCIDLDPVGLDGLKSSPYGNIFDPDRFFTGKEGTGKNFAKGYFESSAGLVGDILEMIRKEVERCDCAEGFQIINGLGGGCGTSLGTLLMENLPSDYERLTINAFSMIPAPSSSDIVVYPYNFALNFPSFQEGTTQVFCMDNDALFRIFTEKLFHCKCSYEETNWLVAHTMAGITAPMRFSGPLTTTYHKIHMNLCANNRWRYHVPGFLPLEPFKPKNPPESFEGSLAELALRMFDPRNLIASCSNFRQADDSILSFGSFFRGQLSPKLVMEAVQKMKKTYWKNFHPAVKAPFYTTICSMPPICMDFGAAFAVNTTALRHVFRRILNDFNHLYEQKRYLSLYEQFGIDEADWEKAMQSLINATTTTF